MTPSARRIALVVPGPLSTRSGGYEYDRRIAAGLRGRGWTVDVYETADLAPIPEGTLTLVDGLALGRIPEQAERHSRRLLLVALVHLPLADAVGLAREDMERLHLSERRALAACAFSIVTGATTAAALATRYGVPSDRIAVIEPGTDAAPLARGSNTESVHLVCVAALTQGKGHELLVDALATVRMRQWTLTCAGSLERDAETVARVRARLAAAGLEQQVSLAGELETGALAALYDSADLFVLATLHETYGMAVAEALARGLPVVSTMTGAIPGLVGQDAGLLAPTGDVEALAAALDLAIGDAALRGRLAAGARRVRDRLPTWDSATGRMVAVLESIARDGRITAL